MTNEKLGISPGQHTLKYANKCHKHWLKRQQSQTQPSAKRRCLVLKQERAVNQGAMEALEGVSYQSGVCHSSNADIENIPDAIPQGNFKAIKLHGAPTFVVIDLETTDLIRDSIIPHITQIAAAEVKSGNTFSVYVKPKVPVSTEAQRRTGISVSQNNNVFLKGNLVKSENIDSALNNLCVWLQKYSNVCLVAHNGRRFDFPVLITATENSRTTDDFLQCVSGMIDSLAVFKKKIPNQSHKQEDLVSQYLGITYDAHNAEANVTALGKLINLCDESELLSFSFHVDAMIKSLKFNRAKTSNFRSLEHAISCGIMKRPTAVNISGSGLNLDHLLTIYKRSGEDGLHSSFTARNSDGQPRVTNSKKVLEEVIPKLAKYLDSRLV